MTDCVIDIPAVVADVAVQCARYEAALMANDLATLDGLFWRSESVVRYGATENLHGAGAIAAFRAARPGGAPQRRVLRQTITTFGHDFATANIEFQPLGSSRVGRQSQSWVRLSAGWRIVAAHVSFVAEP